jgi:CheY-like chemotaxis protein
MTTLAMLVLGPSDAGRRALEDGLRDLGHVVIAAEPDTGEAALDWEWDLVVVDARDPALDWRPVALDLAADRRPLLAVTREPRRLADAIGARRGGIVLMSGDESREGRERAVQLCAALRGVTGDDPRQLAA